VEFLDLFLLYQMASRKSDLHALSLAENGQLGRMCDARAERPTDGFPTPGFLGLGSAELRHVAVHRLEAGNAMYVWCRAYAVLCCMSPLIY
jgi:hypothetical protein